MLHRTLPQQSHSRSAERLQNLVRDKIVQQKQMDLPSRSAQLQNRRSHALQMQFQRTVGPQNLQRIRKDQLETTQFAEDNPHQKPTKVRHQRHSHQHHVQIKVSLLNPTSSKICLLKIHPMLQQLQPLRLLVRQNLIRTRHRTLLRLDVPRLTQPRVLPHRQSRETQPHSCCYGMLGQRQRTRL